MRRKILDGIGTALLALILGVIVWVNATYQSDRPREDPFPEPIPIQVLSAPTGFVATNDPIQHVTVRIRAFSSSWATLTTDDFSATADWGRLAEGMHAVPIKVACSDRTTTIMSVHPRTAYVQLERTKKELKDVVGEVDTLVDGLVDQLGGAHVVTAAEWLLLNQLRSAQIVVGGVFRHAAAQGIIEDESRDLVPALKRVGSFTNTVRLCLLQLKLTGSDGEPTPDIGARLRAIEVKGGRNGGE